MTIKTLTTIVLLALGLNSCECGELETKPIKQSQQHSVSKNISGEIVHIDEDSFGVTHYGNFKASGFNFEFENIRIKGEDGKIYKLISSGPTSYAVGDTINVNFEKLPGYISYSDLFYFKKPAYPRGDEGEEGFIIEQKGSIKADGIIR